MKRILFSFLPIVLIAIQSSCSTDFWSEHGPGITDRISSSNAVYLTLDACGSAKGKAYDAELIAFLRANKIPATLFMNARWIDANPDIFMELANDPLFKIGNHGMEHKPASTIGREIYGIKGTTSPAALIAEIQDNADKIERLTGTRPLWFRSGTAYYDAPAINIITQDLNMKIAGFAETIDAGATLTADEVFARTISARPGDILLGHMNHPESGTRDGLIRALPLLKAKGYAFELLPE